MGIFDKIKHNDPDGQKCRSRRDLARALEYSDYRNLGEVIEKAKTACKTSRQPVSDHFVDVNEMV